MLFTDQIVALASKKNEKARQAIYKEIALFSIGGAIGVGLNDMWRLLHLQGDAEEIVIHGEKKGVYWDELYQGAIAGAVAALEFLAGFKGAATVAAGMGFGIAMAGKSERRGYVGFL